MVKKLNYADFWKNKNVFIAATLIVRKQAHFNSVYCYR